MRHELTLIREDGTVVRLVSLYFTNLFAPDEIEHFALVRKPGSDEEVLFTVDHTKTLGGLSVDEYIKHGRKGLLSVVRPHEIIKAGNMLIEKMSVDDGSREAHNPRRHPFGSMQHSNLNQVDL